MFDRISAVTAITNWPGSLGVKLPKALADKIEVFDAVRYVETAHAVIVDTSSVTTKNADDAVAEPASRLLPAQSEPGKRSALDEAKSAILNQLGVEILREASQALPDVIEQLRPGFELAVSSFTEAVQNLPEKLTSEALVAAGPSAVNEYQNARDAASIIASLDSWLAELINLPAYAGLQTSPALRVLSPANQGELAKLRAAHDSRNADPLETELGKLYLCAAREGIEFGLNTPAESAQIRQTIESTPREKTRGVA
jgi:hypothetical protein